MAIRYTVYCQRSVAGVTPEQLLAGVCEADLFTIAENNDVPDDVIEDALAQLRIENVDPQGFRWYRLCYRPAGVRQIDVERWQTADEVRARGGRGAGRAGSRGASRSGPPPRHPGAGGRCCRSLVRVIGGREHGPGAGFRGHAAGSPRGLAASSGRPMIRGGSWGIIASTSRCVPELRWRHRQPAADPDG